MKALSVIFFVRIGTVLFSILNSFSEMMNFMYSWVHFAFKDINCRVKCGMFSVCAVNNVLDTTAINFAGMGRHSQMWALLRHLISYFGITLHTLASNF